MNKLMRRYCRDCRFSQLGMFRKCPDCGSLRMPMTRKQLRWMGEVK